MKEKTPLETASQKLLDMELRLRESEHRVLLLDTMINIAETKLKIDIRKKSGDKPSKQ